MNKEQEIHGTIEQWHREQVSRKEFIIYGYVYGDTKGRFPDGTYIQTSGVMNRAIKEGDIVKTRNSVYKLGKESLEHAI